MQINSHMFVRVLSITAGALLATAIVAAIIYFCWLGLAGLLNDNSSLDPLFNVVRGKVEDWEVL
jgi:hypothetical protein